MFLRHSSQDGCSAALDLDTNEYMGIGKLARIIRSIGIVDTITNVASNDRPASRMNGSKKYDMWTSSNLSISVASFCPYQFAVGAHMVTMVYFDKKNILGSDYFPAYPISMCRIT